MSNDRLTIGPAHLLTGNGSPIDLGIQAPTGSLYLDQSGSSKMWIEAGTIGQGGGGTTYTAITDWDSRGTGSDGDWGIYTLTGAVYRYSSTVGEWIRPDVYAGTVTFDLHIVGTENSIADLTGSSIGLALTDGSSGGTPTVTSTSGECTISAGAGSGVIGVFYGEDTGRSTASNLYMSGYVRGSAGTGAAWYLFLGDGTGASRPGDLATSPVAGNWTDRSVTPDLGLGPSATVKRWVDVVVDQECSWCFFDHEVVPSVVLLRSSLAASSSKWSAVVAGAGTGACSVTVSELRGGSF